MHDVVERLEVYLFSLRQEVPYLGPLRSGEQVNPRGYFVRKGNRTVYPRELRSLVLKLQTRDGVVGWGETYGLVAPRATAEIIYDLLEGFVFGRNPLDVEDIHDELYDLMRVRGYTGGFYMDAPAAVDIALWDAKGKLLGRSLVEMLVEPSGKKHCHTIPAYVSGLPKETLSQRCELAADFQARGYNDFKFAAPVADQGVEPEFAALRERLGEDARIACDLHWANSSSEAIALAESVSSHGPWFLEAPVATEEIEELRSVAGQVACPIAVGEEWRTVFDARLRVDRQACHIVQPEMGHTGVTQFMRIGRHAEAHDLQIIPHATIGVGLFLAASLQASAALQNVVSHEYQHSIFDKTSGLANPALTCEAGKYTVPTGDGIGLEPTAKLIEQLELVKKM